MKPKVIIEWGDKFAPSITVKCGHCGEILTASEIAESQISEIVEHAWQKHFDTCSANRCDFYIGGGMKCTRPRSDWRHQPHQSAHHEYHEFQDIRADAVDDVRRTFARLDSKYGNDWTEWQDVREAIAKL